MEVEQNAGVPKEIYGAIFNIQQFSIHDGPGMRTTMFVKGCPLKCPWCSNPESIDPTIQIKIHPEKCSGCGGCLAVCESKALFHNENKKINLEYSKCSHCMACHSICQYGGIEVVGFKISVKDAVAQLLKDKDFYKNTGGGVTISGGEPLVQHKFVSAVFENLRRVGIHTALDTCGYAPYSALEEVINHVNLVLFDIKHLNPETHKKTVGVKNDVILENLKKLSGKVEIWLRVPLIPGFNDDFELADNIISLGRKVGAKRVYFLPFHRWGEHKYPRLGLKNTYEEYREFFPEEAKSWKEKYKDQASFVMFGQG
jgi:pyruvate formate lyase activating enzyme